MANIVLAFFNRRVFHFHKTVVLFEHLIAHNIHVLPFELLSAAELRCSVAMLLLLDRFVLVLLVSKTTQAAASLGDATK